MDTPLNVNDNDILFEFNTYEDFTRERLKLNYESTLKLWYSLPTGLPEIDMPLAKRHTPREQRARKRKVKLFAVYCILLNRTCVKKKIRSRAIRLWNDILNVPSLQGDYLYGIYRSLSRITDEFLTKAKQYDRTIRHDELFKAVRLLWFMIGFQMQFNLPLTKTDSIFGYNMLYPYTDDLIDCNDVTREAKKEFARVFHERLLIGEPNYDPKAHFNGHQSNVTEMRLPPSLQPYADRIGKIFDMVKFIENDWTRRGVHECVYMSLATIHEAQMKSTLQHARPDDGYEPTMTQIEQVSAEKGGASLMAAGYLIEGRLSRAKVAYLEYFGFALQLVDDLQDVGEDMKNNHRTIFTQSIAEGQMLDAPTARLIRFCFCAPTYEKFPDNHTILSDTGRGVTMAHYIPASTMMLCVILILEAASRLSQYYSREFYCELSTLSPFTFNDLKGTRIEKKVWRIVRHQWF